MIDKTAMQVLFNILRMYEVTSFNLDEKLASILEKEGIELDAEGVMYVLDNYSLI